MGRPCLDAATCRIWDWSLRGGDAALRGVFAAPSGREVLTHRWAASSAAACGKLAGAAWNAGTASCSSRFLRHAVELAGAGLGNGNGLCEAGETCLHTANGGAYQGHGALEPLGSSTTGEVPDVQLLRYTANGR